ncbi:carboxypeptidase regulatory-like domain-containing protein [bacterium]|nr:carboxypeptidase regulatory-like domain-containing protein [bacterium]
MNKKVLSILIALTLVFTISSVADAKRKKKKKKEAAYKVTAVTNGGSIAGVATFAGTPPADPMIQVTSDVENCKSGTEMPRQKYIIADGKIANAVIYLEDIKEGKDYPAEPLVFNNVTCKYEPHVGITFKGKEVTLRNSDPMFHNVHSYVDGKTLLNLGLPDPGFEVTKKMKKDGIMEVKCDAHPWMLGYIFIATNPYAAVSAPDGSYTLTDVPAGTYAIKAWHEGFGDLDLGTVTVEGGAVATVNVEYK